MNKIRIKKGTGCFERINISRIIQNRKKFPSFKFVELFKLLLRQHYRKNSRRRRIGGKAHEKAVHKVLYPATAIPREATSQWTRRYFKG